jgi:hypothetical protein
MKWERALDLAVKNKTHVDTVLAYSYENKSRRKEEILLRGWYSTHTCVQRYSGSTVKMVL